MYTTKVFNAKTASAFQPESKERREHFSFVLSSEPYGDKGLDLPERFKGKRPAVPKAFSRTGNFSEITYTVTEGGDVPGGPRYIPTQPRETRKNAFGSNDARRRDEFLHHVRSRQFVEQVNSEARAGKPRSSLAAVGASIASADSSIGAASGAGDGLAAEAGVTLSTRIAPASPLNPRATGSLAATLADTLASLTKTRDFAARTEFDRRLDPRSPRTVYGVRARASSHSAVETGSFSRTSGEVGDGLDAIRPAPPEARKVSVVREFFRTNGGH